MTSRTTANTLVMIHPIAPYLSKQMPNHIPGVKQDGSTTRYFKHPSHHQMAEFDYKTVSILGQVMTRKEMIDLFTKFVSECRTFGIKGGKKPQDTANRAFSCLLKEGLIVRV